MESLKMILEELQPTIITLCETKLAESAHGLLEETLNKKQYKIIPRYTKAGEKGMVVAVKHNNFKTIRDVTQSQLKTIISVRLSTGSNNFRVILGYAPQETADDDDRESFFNELELEIKNCEETGDSPLVLGDFNARIEPSEETPYGIPKSKNGRALHNILTEHDLPVMNFTDTCTGKWTHEVRTTGATSVIEYVAMDSILREKITSMVIDDCALHCPFGVTKTAGETITTLSDHNPIMLQLTVPRYKSNPESHSPKWIFKADGFNTMAQVFDENCDTVEVDESKPQETYNNFQRMVETTLDKSFKKTKAARKKSAFCDQLHKDYKPVCKELTKFAARGKIQREIALQYRKKLVKLNSDKISTINASKLFKRVQELSEDNKFNHQKFWKTKKSIQSSIRTCNSVYNQNGKEVFEEEEIIDAYRSEFDSRLSSVQIKDSLRNFKTKREQICDDIIELVGLNKEPDFTSDELDKVLNSLKQGKAHGPDRRPAEIYKHGGKRFRDLLLNIINMIKRTHVIPTQWEEMMITTIYKGKGTQKDLVNQRGIFLTQVICKIWERLIKLRTGEATAKINKRQAGSTTGKCPADQLFLLRSCISHAKYLNQTLYLNFYDFRQCFDKLWLQDSIISLYKLGLKNEFLALIFETNRRASISVNTPLGMSKPFTKTMIVKQGSVTASSLCSASTGELCDELVTGGVQIGKININSLAYVDDLTTANTNVTDSSSSHKTVCFFSDKKKLPLNEGKCYLLPVNCKKYDPIPHQTVNNKPVIIKDQAPYLGDIINRKGDYKDLIDDRTRKGTVVMINSIHLCSDSQMGMYAINALLLMHKSVFTPTILFNSEAWDNLTLNDVTRLKTLQLKYLKWMLRTPRGTCNAFVYLELGILPMDSLINIRKMIFLHHILNLDDDDPVKMTYQQQQVYLFEKNWAYEVRKLLKAHHLETDTGTIQELPKKTWKQMVKKAVTQETLASLNAECSEKSKTEGRVYHQFEEQPYFHHLSASRARKYFQLRGNVYNFKCNRPFQHKDDVCRLCGEEREDTNHVLNFCSKISRSSKVFVDLWDIAEDDIQELFSRLIQFELLIEED